MAVTRPRNRTSGPAPARARRGCQAAAGTGGFTPAMSRADCIVGVGRELGVEVRLDFAAPGASHSPRWRAPPPTQAISVLSLGAVAAGSVEFTRDELSSESRGDRAPG
jgi:hypothetical protein